jgi:multicomponent Na+:H+ antiporter subunit E
MTRVLLFAAAWWILVEGRADAWIAGVLAVALAVGFGRALGLAASPVRIHPTGLLRFIPFFLWQSVRGGVDVAMRALHPRLPIQPSLISYRFSLRGEAGRIFFINAVSLLPGTFVAEWLGDTVIVHVLDGGEDAGPRLRALEARIGAVLGEPPDPEPAHG